MRETRIEIYGNKGNFHKFHNNQQLLCYTAHNNHPNKTKNGAPRSTNLSFTWIEALENLYCLAAYYTGKILILFVQASYDRK